MTQGIDVTKLTLMLNELRLPTIKQLWPTFAERSDKEGWPAARFLSAITEHEIAERGRRRMERHLAEARSEGRRVGKEWVSRGGSRWWPGLKKKKRYIK